jgi:hypothetical protein
LAQTKINFDNLYLTLNISPDKVVKEFVVIKPFPTDSSSSIIIIPVKTIDDEDAWTADVYLLRINNRSGEILCHSQFEKSLENNAIRLNAIQIDTAVYQVKENEKAFAIKLFYANDSHATGYIGEEFRLFEERGNQFFQILGLDNIYESLSYGGGDCENIENYDKTSTFTIDSKNSKNGYFNIIEDILFEHYHLKKDCEAGEKDVKNFRNIFEFVNNSYQCKGERNTGF